jgi:hypothetical protein
LVVATVLVSEFGGGSKDTFSHEIDQPIAVVAAAVQNADIAGQPHTIAKLTLAERERIPVVISQRDADGVSWFVMSGEKSVLHMKATLAPTGPGATHVETSVEQGQLSGDAGIPAVFSKPELMAPLFAVAVERSLGEFIPGSERTLYSRQERPQGYSRRENAGEIARMRSAPEPGVSFQPGKPMVHTGR